MTSHTIRKRYVRTRYLPFRKAKLNVPFYGTKLITNYYHTQLSSLLPRVHFSFNDGDLQYTEKEEDCQRVSIPDNSNLHNMSNLVYNYEYVIMTINYEWTTEGEHVSTSIVDTKNKRIEWFDTYNTFKYIYNPIKNKLQEYFPDYHIVKAHQKSIQEDDEDHYCQTWLYYYLYHRLHKKKTMKSIIGKLMSKDKKRRIDVIRKFHYKIERN